jgi:hypothetical protein
LGLRLDEAAPEGEVLDLQSLRTLQEVGEVKVADVVADDDIWVSLQDQVPPPLHIPCQRLKILQIGPVSACPGIFVSREGARSSWSTVAPVSSQDHAEKGRGKVGGGEGAARGR